MTQELQIEQDKSKANTSVTEVTSISREEQKTGTKINVPTPEELVAKATASYIRNLEGLDNIIRGHKGGSYHISRRGMNRVLIAILQLPMDDLHNTLQGEAEKLAFSLGQRIIADRFIITQHHINEEIKKIKAKQESTQNITEETKVELTTDKGEKNE
jgi:hypothetical protein